MKKLPISVFIITKNEEKRIIPTIKAVKNWVDEVIVIDSGSTDKTVKVAKKLGCKTYFHKWKGYGPQKVFGEKKCKNNWILNVDSDEVVSTKLKNEIKKLFKSNKQDEYCGYRIKITNVLPSEKKPHKWAYSFNQTRLYNKKNCGFRNSPTHDAVIIKGVKEYSFEEKKFIGQLENRIAHHFMESYTQLIKKWNTYSQMLAEEALKKNKKVSKPKAIISPILAFFKAYLLRRYFVYGFNGFVFSLLYASSRFWKYIKIIEINQKGKK